MYSRVCTSSMHSRAGCVPTLHPSNMHGKRIYRAECISTLYHKEHICRAECISTLYHRKRIFRAGCIAALYHRKRICRAESIPTLYKRICRVKCIPALRRVYTFTTIHTEASSPAHTHRVSTAMYFDSTPCICIHVYYDTYTYTYLWMGCRVE